MDIKFKDVNYCEVLTTSLSTWVQAMIMGLIFLSVDHGIKLGFLCMHVMGVMINFKRNCFGSW